MGGNSYGHAAAMGEREREKVINQPTETAKKLSREQRKKKEMEKK